jgi:replicative DNA helicase
MNFHTPPEQFQTMQDHHGAEFAILARCIAKPDSIPEIVDKVVPADFEHPFLARCFAAIVGLNGEGRKPSIESLVAELGNDEIEPHLTVRQFLFELATQGVSGYFLPVGDAIEVLRDRAQRRTLAVLGANLMAATAGAKSVSTIVEDMAAGLDDVSASLRQSARSTYSAAGASDVVFAHLDGPENTTPKTGLADLDEVLGGWPKGELSVVAARPGMGKSCFATNALIQAAKVGHGCMFFSLEMTARQLGSRLLTDAAFGYKKPEVTYSCQQPALYQDLLRRNESRLNRAKLQEARDFLAKLPITIEEQRGLTITDIAARARKLATKLDKDGGTLDVLFVDHMLLVKPSSRYSGNRVREVAEISDGLASLAKDLNCAVVALCQLNRGVEGRESKRPTLSDLRDSGAIEEDASTVTFLYRPHYYLEQKKPEDVEAQQKHEKLLAEKRTLLEFIVAKNRNGAVGIVEAFVEIGANAVRNKGWLG